MLSKSVQEALNDQIGKEFSSAFIYLAMSASFQTMNLPGCAHWMRLQYQEEVSHAMKLFGYVHDRGGTVVLQGIKQPPAKYKSPLDIFEQALSHERGVTASIHKLFALAQKEGDFPTQIALQWFVTEQVEEEKHATEIVNQLSVVGDNKLAMMMLDRQLGARTGG